MTLSGLVVMAVSQRSFSALERDAIESTVSSLQKSAERDKDINKILQGDGLDCDKE